MGQQVSIFSLDKRPVSSQNLKYPLNESVLDNLWKGSLNESLGETFTLHTEGKIIVYRTFEVRSIHHQNNSRKTSSDFISGKSYT